MKVEVPDFLLEMSERLNNQDNLCTADPVFIVQEKYWISVDKELTDPEGYHIYSADFDSCEKIDSSDPNWKKYLNDEIEEMGGKDNVHIIPVVSKWKHEKFFLTRVGAENYIKCNGHNHDELRIYVDSMFRCHEMIELRKWIMDLIKDNEQ